MQEVDEQKFIKQDRLMKKITLTKINFIVIIKLPKNKGER